MEDFGTTASFNSERYIIQAILGKINVVYVLQV